MFIPIKDAVDIGTKVLQKVESDPDFREFALQDGSAAVEQVMGSQLPDGLKVKFVEAPRGTITIGLPPPIETDELTDAELEQIAGGRVDANTGAGIAEGAGAAANAVVMGILQGVFKC